MRCCCRAIGLGGVTGIRGGAAAQEIGTRMALGARGRPVQGIVLREGTGLAAAGLAMGFYGLFALCASSPAATTCWRGVSATARRSWLVVGALLLLAVLAMPALYLPARRAARIDSHGRAAGG